MENHIDMKLFNDYFQNKLSEELLIEKIGLKNLKFPIVLYKEIESEIERKNEEMLAYLIYALMLWDERIVETNKFSLQNFVDLLNQLLICRWHKQHENIVKLLQKISHESSVDFLYKAIDLDLPYLRWDDNYSFQLKCIRTMGNIGGPKAVSYLKILSEDRNPIIREKARDRAKIVRCD